MILSPVFFDANVLTGGANLISQPTDMPAM
jgi:hypothetical protein